MYSKCVFFNFFSFVITDLDIGILINNAAEFQHEALDKISPDGLLRASIVNCHAPALLARYFIPKMLERYQKVVWTMDFKDLKSSYISRIDITFTIYFSII
jgi:short-subunit dehydrogenase